MAGEQAAPEWVNKDILAHTATAPGDRDVTIAASKSASAVLKNAGTVDYSCRFHPDMKGRIIVAPKQGAPRVLAIDIRQQRVAEIPFAGAALEKSLRLVD